MTRTAILLLLAGVTTAVQADPVTYRCTSPGQRPAFLQLDEKLKTIKLGRSEDKLEVTEPAIYTAQSVTWTHAIGSNAIWNYTFERATEVLIWGPPGRQTRDTCKKI